MGIFLVFLLMMGYGWMIACLGRKVKSDFFGYMKERLGKITAGTMTVLFMVYAFLNLAYLVNIFANLGTSFVLTEEGELPLMLLLLGGALYVALGGLEIRGRVAETLYPLLFYPLLALMVFCGFHMRPEYVSFGSLNHSELSFLNLFPMFSSFGGMVFFLFVCPGVENKKAGGKAYLRGLFQAALGLFFLFVIIGGTFGDSGISRETYPAVQLMTSASLPGGFVERWDVIFTALLLTQLYISAGASLHYLFVLGKYLIPGFGGRKTGVLLCGLALLATLGFGSSQKAVALYSAINSFLVVPAGAAMVGILLWIERVKGGRRA